MANYTDFLTDYPQHIAPASVELTSMHNTQVNVSHSLRQTASTRGSQRFRIKFDYAPMTRDEFAPIFAFLMEQKGRFEKFTVALPNQEPRGILTAAANEQLKINANASAGSNTIQIKNHSVGSVNGFYKQGDFFRIGGRPKVYVVRSDVQSAPVNAPTTVEFYPQLTENVNTNDVVHFEPVFQVALMSDESSVVMPLNQTNQFSVEFIEAIS